MAKLLRHWVCLGFETRNSFDRSDMKICRYILYRSEMSDQRKEPSPDKSSIRKLLRRVNRPLR